MPYGGVADVGWTGDLPRLLSAFDSSADFLSTRAHGGVFNASTDRKAPNFHAAAAKYNLRHGVPAHHLRLSSIQLVRFSRRLLTRIVALSTRPEYAMHSELRAASICAMTATQWREQRERRDEVSNQELFPCTMDSLFASRPSMFGVFDSSTYVSPKMLAQYETRDLLFHKVEPKVRGRAANTSCDAFTSPRRVQRCKREAHQLTAMRANAEGARPPRGPA